MTISPATLKSALKSTQAWWSDMGVDVDFPVTPLKKKRAPKPEARIATAVETRPSVDLTQISAKANAATTLDALKDVIASLDVGDLSDNAQNTVFARGNPDSDLMCIGEAPGREEDESGLPFVGQAGHLFDKMLAAIGHSEDNTYITNICNWHPPGNRNPSAGEIELCRPLIMRHIELAAPKLVVIIGGVSLTALSGRTGIMKTRGQWQTLSINGQEIPAMPIYHPEFLLRRPELKKDAWRDLLAIKDRLCGI